MRVDGAAAISNTECSLITVTVLLAWLTGVRIDRTAAINVMEFGVEN